MSSRLTHTFHLATEGDACAVEGAPPLLPCWGLPVEDVGVQSTAPLAVSITGQAGLLTTTLTGNLTE